MKSSRRGSPRTCPHCGQTFTEHPALSRTDNETLICPDCGIREALKSLGVAPKEQEEIVGIIRRCSSHYTQ